MAAGETYCGPLCHDFLLDSMKPDRDLGDNPDETVMRAITPMEPMEAWGYRSKLWQKHDLKVHFLTPHHMEDTILEWASEWSQHCAIQFHKTGDVSGSDIRIDFKNAGAWSFLGTDSRWHHHSMNFGFLDRPTVLHEFGHALGLSHEHQSPFFAGIEWNEDVVIKSLSGPPNRWDIKKIRHNVLDKRPLTSDGCGTAYDPKSIMHYSYPSEWFKGGTSGVIKPNRDLSELDKKLLGDLYGGPRGPFKTRPAPFQPTPPQPTPSGPTPPQLSRLNETVKIHNLTHMEVGANHVRLIKEVQMRWVEVGDFLELQHFRNEDKGVGQEFQTCRGVFDSWVKGQGREPKTWQTVLDLLSFLDLTATDTYRNLERCLQ